MERPICQASGKCRKSYKINQNSTCSKRYKNCSNPRNFRQYKNLHSIHPTGMENHIQRIATRNNEKNQIHNSPSVLPRGQFHFALRQFIYEF